MPKAPLDPLYNHNTRPAASRVLSLSTQPGGRHCVQYATTQSAVHALFPQPPSSQDFYLMKVDIAELSTNSDENNNFQKDLLGLHIMCKSKASRYDNSVHCIFFNVA
jgi:hypothetical protein